MNWDLPAECEEAFRSALKQPLLDSGPSTGSPARLRDSGAVVMDRAAVEAVLPHRAPFLLIGQVTTLDLEKGVIGACYDLNDSRDVLAGHFPGRPVWPGVLQVEAIGQAGIILYLLMQGTEGPASEVSMTHIAAARFMRPVAPTPLAGSAPGGDVEIAARVFDDGYFVTVVGQCLRDGEICSAAVVNILVD